MPLSQSQRTNILHKEMVNLVVGTLTGTVRYLVGTSRPLGILLIARRKIKERNRKEKESLSTLRGTRNKRVISIHGDQIQQVVGWLYATLPGNLSVCL